MHKKQIGVMLPASSVFPIGKEYEKGIADGIENANPNFEFELVKEFIGQGGNRQIEEACNKFFNYLDVDAVTGFVSNKVLELVHSKFMQKQKPLLASNVGGHIPRQEKLNDYVHINSMNLWAHAWALGYWAARNIGGKGMYVSALYDSGYGFSNMFYEGMKASKTDCQWCFSVAKGPAEKSLSDLTNIFIEIEQQNPDFILATFCGEETQLFINALIEKGLHKKVKLLGLPYLLSPCYPFIDSIEVYSTMPVSDTTVTAEKVFYHLGHEVGQTLAAAFNESENDLNRVLIMNRKTSSPNQENVTVTISTIEPNAPPRVAVVTNIEVPVQDIVSANAEDTFGWLNPYLCI